MRELERDSPTSSAAAQHAALPALAVVGAGRVGSSFAAAAERAGLSVALAGRTEAIEACLEADAVLLCVPDDAIERAAQTIASSGPKLRFAGHTSGASTLAPLAPLAAAGASTFSLHPLQTVPDRSTDFTGCPSAIAGADEQAVELARALAERLGMIPFEIAEDRRAAYHAAACLASNFLIALEESAAALLGEAGPEDARELLAPLVLRTAANWSERGAAALTGPIARGDEATVARHLEALREIAPELVPLYEALAERTRELAKERHQ
jgi:predicted short-subunit dehydrogenase-like oxidoreductase (DUF2520 family)